MSSDEEEAATTAPSTGTTMPIEQNGCSITLLNPTRFCFISQARRIGQWLKIIEAHTQGDQD